MSRTINWHKQLYYTTGNTIILENNWEIKELPRKKKKINIGYIGQKKEELKMRQEESLLGVIETSNIKKGHFLVHNISKWQNIRLINLYFLAF